MAEEEEKKEDTTVEAGESEVKPGPEAETSQNSGAESEAETPAEEEKPADPEKSSSAKTTEDKPAEPDWKALYALTLADFDNYKKLAARDREDTYRYAEMDILKDILPVVDGCGQSRARACERQGEV